LFLSIPHLFPNHTIMTQPPLRRSIATLLAVSMLSTPIAATAQVESAVQRELRRRYDYEARGNAAVLEGDKFMKQRDYAKAHAAYKQAVTLIPNSSNTEASYRRAVEKFGDSCGKLAEQRIAEGRYADAEMLLRDLLDNYDPKNKQAVVILSRLEMPDYYNKTITPKFVGNVEQVKQWFIDAEGFYNSGRYDLAFKRCEQILNTDPYNIAAQQMKEKIDKAMSDAHLAGYNETRARAMREIDKAWVRPIRKFNIVTDTGPIEQGTQSSGNVARIQKKLERIMIPSIEFKEATIREAVEFLKKKSKDLDTTEEREEDRGVNIVLKLDSAGGGGAMVMPEPAAPVAPAIPGLEPLPGAAPAPVAPMAAPMPTANPGDARISISLTNIPLIEALKYVTGLANLKFKVEPFAVSIVPQSVNIDTVYTKEWKVRPDLISRTPGGGGGGLEAPAAAPPDATRGGTGIGAREAAKDWLIAQGVTFGPNASAIYIPTSSKLIVRNTQEMLDLIDQIIESSTGSGPVQIDIEAKFVEISQNNLKELSFDWLLGAFNIGGQSVFGTGGTAGTSPQTNPLDFPIVTPGGVPVGQNPVTGGNRSGQLGISANAIDALLFGTAGSSLKAPGIFGIAGAFTDPTFQVVIRALNQKKGVDLLSAPRVTTKSGQRAVIEIIREFRYPTEFDPPQIPQNFGNQGNQGGGGGIGVTIVQAPSSFPVTPTTPTAFETRNTGVTLEVEPVIGPDGYTIDLNLVPQVVEFEGFINYGSPIQTTATNPITGITSTNVITPNVINQPIFSTRKVTTSVSIFDGQTVVLGGLMREDIQKVEDKVPLLGDIPLVGRLFRSSVDQHLKRNLIIFVSARLMNPAGDPVRSEEEPEEVVETLPAPEISLPNELPLMPK
jgi:general secretion pathway protein D